MNRAINSDYDLQRYFEEYGRGEQFSPYGFKALFEYLEEYEEATGESLTVDPVSLSCDFTEYESATEALAELHGSAVELLTEERALELLEEQKTVIRVADYISTGGLRVIIEY
jgi:hypothetical protein